MERISAVMEMSSIFCKECFIDIINIIKIKHYNVYKFISKPLKIFSGT